MRYENIKDGRVVAKIDSNYFTLRGTNEQMSKIPYELVQSEIIEASEVENNSYWVKLK